MNLLKIPLLVLLFSAAPAVGQLSWQVPNGRPVIVDGKLDSGKWDDATVRELPGLAKVRIKQCDQYVFLAITLNSGDGAVDLYLSPSASEVYDLHASAKLGERKLRNGVWPAWNWWNNPGCVANTSRAESFQRGSFLPTATREYQISKTRFPGRSWKVMFGVAVPGQPNWSTDRYPSGATPTNTDAWIQLELEQEIQKPWARAHHSPHCPAPNPSIDNLISGLAIGTYLIQTNRVLWWPGHM